MPEPWENDSEGWKENVDPRDLVSDSVPFMDGTVNECIVGTEYRFHRPRHAGAVPVKEFDGRTPILDFSRRGGARTFTSAVYVGKPEECLWLPEGMLPDEVVQFPFPKGLFVGRAEEEQYLFLAVSKNDPGVSGFDVA